MKLLTSDKYISTYLIKSGSDGIYTYHIKCYDTEDLYYTFRKGIRKVSNRFFVRRVYVGFYLKKKYNVGKK